jgi:YidC/Oxa1 family membrane protein insertase
VAVLILIFWVPIMEKLGFIPKEQPQPIAVQDTLSNEQPLDTTQIKTGSTPGAISKPDTTAFVQEVPDSTEMLVEERLISVETPLYKLTFSTYGGGLEKIVLRKYDYADDGNIVLADAVQKIVPDVFTSGGAFRGSNHIFETDANDFVLSQNDSPRTIEFRHKNGRGGTMIKRYTINPDQYTIQCVVEIDGIENFGFERFYRLMWDITPPPTEKNAKDDYSKFKPVAFMSGNLVELDDYDNDRMHEDIPGNTEWAGIRTKYFTMVMIPRTRPGDGFVGSGVKKSAFVNGQAVTAKEIAGGITMPIPSYGDVTDSFTIYVGPIEYGRLQKHAQGLDELTSLGWVIIKPFSRAIIWLLPKIHDVIPNYGIVVMIFAVMIKLITYPLSRKQTRAMAKMREVQPKMKALQEKYKSDPARLNKEMMKLYKEAGANPLTGCLPLLPQMPLFFALFQVFRTTIEFRGADFILWITDLSVPDPYYVLPIIMVITMFVQQKVTMTDPKNKMMTYLLPLVFGFMFLNFPAGLVLYWTSFNILSFLEVIFVSKPHKQQQVTVVEEKT